jgi:hypothetical protein
MLYDVTLFKGGTRPAVRGAKVEGTEHGASAYETFGRLGLENKNRVEQKSRLLG